MPTVETTADDRRAVVGQGVDQLARSDAAAERHLAGGCVELDRLQSRHIDDEVLGLECAASHVVASADDRDVNPLPACERHGVLNRFLVGWANDAERRRFNGTVELDGLEVGFQSAFSAAQRGGGYGSDLLP